MKNVKMCEKNMADTIFIILAFFFYCIIKNSPYFKENTRNLYEY